MASVARLLTFLQNGSLHKLETVPRVFWPIVYRHQILSHQNQQRFLYCCCVVIPKVDYSTSKTLFKKSELANKDEKKKAPAISKDEKMVQVFDETGLFVGKQKFWKAKADAAKKNLRLLEIHESVKSKKKVETDDEAESTDIPSYKLVSVDEFTENLNEAKTQKAKVDKLRQIVIKSNIDKGGLDIKVNQIKDLLMKKGRLKIVIQSSNTKGVTTGRQAVVSTLKKVNTELLGICTIQELSSKENRIIVVASAKDSFQSGESKGGTEENS